MNKAIVGIIVLAAIGAGVWYFTQGNTGTPSGSSPVSSESFTEKSSMKDLVARGGSWKCTFSMTGDTADSSGTVYIAGGKMRGDFTSVVKQANMTVESHMVSDGTYAYTWTNAIPQGFKVAIDQTTTTSSDGFDYNSELDYNCAAWPTDENMFVVPADITFTTVGQ